MNPVPSPSKFPLLALLLLMAAASAPATAFESSWSGFGTLGYARSDRPYTYQRFISDRGTVERDSILGLQLDGKLGDTLSFTVQGKLAAATDSDSGARASIAWGNLSWRPTNDLLFRAGKFRVPLYLHSETSDVGVTFDLARLPAEVYSQSPTDDFTGLAASKTWNFGGSELLLDGYWGRARTSLRVWFRDDLQPVHAAGAQYLPMTVEVQGLAATYRKGEDSYRLGFTRAIATSHTPLLFVRRFPFIPLPGLPGVGYYQTSDGIPGLPMADELEIPVITLGADVMTASGIRVVGEYGRRIIRDSELGYNSAGAYVAVLRPSGRWTPYLSAATLRSTSANRASYDALNGNRVPDIVPDAALINTSQRAGADSSATYDQTSLAMGTSYALSPRHKLKAEWQHVRIGQVSALVDALPGTDVRRQGINLLSLSYSFVF